ncbi:MAG: hypothetical protein ABIH42_11235 [Planctomycetota bacterium]
MANGEEGKKTIIGRIAGHTTESDGIVFHIKTEQDNIRIRLNQEVEIMFKE